MGLGQDPPAPTPHPAPVVESQPPVDNDLTLPLSGLAPIPPHLTLAIKQGKFVDMEWAIAFSNFMAVTVHFDPNRTFSLAAYQGIVLSLARDVWGNSWLLYDKVFRQLAAVNPSIPWHHRETDVWLSTAAASDGPRLPVARPPSTRDQPPPSRANPGPRPICRNWNQGRCTYPSCRYRHVCLSCQAAEHTTCNCPTRQGKKQAAQMGVCNVRRQGGSMQ